MGYSAPIEKVTHPNEGFDLGLEASRQEVVFQQDAALQDLVPMLNLGALSIKTIKTCEFKLAILRQINNTLLALRKAGGTESKLSLWQYDFKNVGPPSSFGNQTPAQARRTLEQFEGSVPDALAKTDDDAYAKTNPQTLIINEGASGADQIPHIKGYQTHD